MLPALPRESLQAESELYVRYDEGCFIRKSLVAHELGHSPVTRLGYREMYLPLPIMASHETNCSLSQDIH